MSTDSQTDVDFDDSSGENWRRKLERERSEALERAEAAEGRLVALERAEAFRSAGVDPSSKMGSYFVKGYDGELTVEAIQAEARDAGLLSDGGQQAAVQSAQPTFADEGVQHSVIDQAMLGASPPVSDPQADMARLRQAVMSGEMQPEQAQVALEALLASNGIGLNMS